jgi:Tfp pilus assembly protein PilN
MIRRLCCFLLLALLGCLVSVRSKAQTHDRDPLTEAETDEMRDTADFPDKRVELMIKFARARMSQIDQLRADPKKAKNRPQEIHDLLQDFTSLVDEIDDNVDMYSSHKTDMRKGLKLLIEADSEWQLSLRRLKEQSPPEELEQYGFVLTNTIDAIKESVEGARTTLQEQVELAKDKKLNKVYADRPD